MKDHTMPDHVHRKEYGPGMKQSRHDTGPFPERQNETWPFPFAQWDWEQTPRPVQADMLSLKDMTQLRARLEDLELRLHCRFWGYDVSPPRRGKVVCSRRGSYYERPTSRSVVANDILSDQGGNSPACTNFPSPKIRPAKASHGQAHLADRSPCCQTTAKLEKLAGRKEICSGIDP